MPRGKGPPVPTAQEAGWAPEPVWTQGLEEKSIRLCRGSNLDRPVVQPVGRHHTDWATRLTVFSLLSKTESRLIKSPVCLSVSPTKNLEPLGRFHKIWYGCNAIQENLDAIIFNIVASIVLKLFRFKFVSQRQKKLSNSAADHGIEAAMTSGRLSCSDICYASVNRTVTCTFCT
jgi:hypothetical protein